MHAQHRGVTLDHQTSVLPRSFDQRSGTHHRALAAPRRALAAPRRALVARRRALTARRRALAELSLLVTELSPLVAELSPLEPRLQPCSGTGLANTACLRPPSTLYSSTMLEALSTTSHAVLDTLCSGTALTTLQPQLDD
jgi:hypothetical protein